MIKINATIHHHEEPDRTDQILTQLNQIHLLINQLGERMSAEFDKLTQEVEETGTAAESIIALVKGLADQLRELKNEPAKILELADKLDATQAAIAAAVLANTPTPPTP